MKSNFVCLTICLSTVFNYVAQYGMDLVFIYEINDLNKLKAINFHENELHRYYIGSKSMCFIIIITILETEDEFVNSIFFQNGKICAVQYVCLCSADGRLPWIKF